MISSLSDLERFQRAFSTMLRTPLDRETHTLRATTSAYPSELVDRVRGAGVPPEERLATYNRQYWFRLFTVLQNEHRSTTALLGAWAFNELAQQFLLAHAPHGHELGSLADTFSAHVLARLPPAGIATIPRAAVVDTLAIDSAFRAAMLAPYEAPLRLTPDAAPTLRTATLVWSRSLTILDENWPFVEQRKTLPAPLGDHRAPLPPALSTPSAWVICRAPRGLCVKPLAPVQAVLLRTLRTHSLGDSLAYVEAHHGAEMIANAQRWFAEGIELGFWTAIDQPRGTT